MFLNEDTVESWLSQQVIAQNSRETLQLPLQNDEAWLVVVVDFEQDPAGNGWGPDEARTMLDQLSSLTLNNCPAEKPTSRSRSTTR